MARGAEDYIIKGQIVQVNDAPAAPLGFGVSVVAIQLLGAFTGTIIPEVSYDNGATWLTAVLVASNFTTTSSITAAGNWILASGGVTNVRMRCSAYTSGTPAVVYVCSTGNTNFSGVVGNTFAINLGGTSPSSATSALGVTQLGLDCFTKVLVLARLQGATGGTLDVVLQSTPNNGTTWYDICHYTQLAAAASLVGYFVSLTRGETYSTTTPVVVNTLDTAAGAGVLAAGQVIPHGLGNGLRSVFQGGAGTSAGAAQVLLCLASTT